VIVLNSMGGWTGPAENIGNFIRGRKLMTIVRNGQVCASACTLIWISGTSHLLEVKARLGVHSTSLSENRRKRNDGGNLKYGDYLRKMGAPEQLIHCNRKRLLALRLLVWRPAAGRELLLHRVARADPETPREIRLLPHPSLLSRSIAETASGSSIASLRGIEPQRTLN
jgi:hypothetical protein